MGDINVRLHVYSRKSPVSCSADTRLLLCRLLLNTACSLSGLSNTNRAFRCSQQQSEATVMTHMSVDALSRASRKHPRSRPVRSR